jgi:arginase family enzyme
VAVLGAPFDGGTTYRSGTRFGPQGIRKISALYGPYSFELGVNYGNRSLLPTSVTCSPSPPMHTTPWFHATDVPNVPPQNLVQIGICGWQEPRPGVQVGRERGTTIMTVTDCVEMAGRCWSATS